MMTEAALVFDADGEAIYWHLPPGRSAVSLPDSRTLWEVLWEARGRLGGVAHTHPGGGPAIPSETDLTTFAAIEAALGSRLKWVIATSSDVATYEWLGPQKLGYQRIAAGTFEWVGRLRALSLEV